MLSIKSISSFLCCLIAFLSFAALAADEIKESGKQNLVPNGNFEKGDKSPDHWDKVNGLTTFWVDGESPTGKCIKMDTDVYESEVKAREREMKDNPDSTAKPKTITSGNKYDTIAGTYGVCYYSDYITIKPGVTYRLSMDARGKKMDAKVFIKGFADTRGRRRKLYQCYKACRSEVAEWKTFSRTFNPTKNTPLVKWIRVELYAYWPPGVYYFDNVVIEKVRALAAQ